MCGLCAVERSSNMLLMGQNFNPGENMFDKKMYIGGKKVDGEHGSLEVINPFDGKIVGTVPRASKRQVDQAMEIAKNFQSNLTRYERQRILTTTANLLTSRRDEISDIITCLLYTSPSPRDGLLSRMPSSA